MILKKVFDAYWYFQDMGNYSLGNVLAGIGPNNHTFGILPPHLGLMNQYPMCTCTWVWY